MYLVKAPRKALREAVIAGIDEAGRGALAGPVVAGACILTEELLLCLRRRKTPFVHWEPKRSTRTTGHCRIADSKKLSPEERRVAYAWITSHCAFGTGAGSVEEIETLGILGATELAMQRAVAHLAASIRPTSLLIDGRNAFRFDYPHTSIIRGDESEPCIAASSIIAKVTRDRVMIELDRAFPQYGFAHHKGYGTSEHLAAIQAHKQCALHRPSFLRKREDMFIG